MCNEADRHMAAEREPPQITVVPSASLTPARFASVDNPEKNTQDLIDRRTLTSCSSEVGF